MKKLIMGDVDLKDGVVPITKAAASLSELIKRARLGHQPIIVTQNGYPAAVILDIDTFTTLRKLAEEQLDVFTPNDNVLHGAK